MSKYLQTHFYNDVAKFNEIGGSFDGDLKEAVNLYLSLIFEELTETITAFEEGNSVELLDGAIDVAVTAFGLIQALNKAGFDTNEAMKRVAKNNLSKYVSVNTFDNTKHNSEGYKLWYMPVFDVVVLKDENGKIRKPVGYKPVVLNDLVPEGFFE